MRLFRSSLITFALVGALLALSAACAFAYPQIHFAPHRSLHRDRPPTTSECESQDGIACYGPTQIETAYNMHALYAQGDEGQGQTIVIVDCFGSPTIQRDLTRFDKAYKLPAPPSLEVIQPAGAVKPWEPGNSEMTGWAGETTLDVEYAHAMAPAAKILLVETPEEETEGVQGFPQIVEAENYVINHKLGNVISQSFSATEESFPSVESLMNLRSAYVNASKHGVTVLDATGDEGVANLNINDEIIPRRTTEWPASDPLVTAIGGDQLHLNEEGQQTAPANVWHELLGLSTVAGAGGPSHVFERPEYQYLINTHSGDKRATPDISMSAAVNGGVLTYQSYPSTSEEKGWSITGGTSEATPLFSGVVAIADQIAGHGLGLINPRMYQMEKEGGATGIVDITEGENGYEEFETLGGPATLKIRGFQAKPGYDMASGLGTVDAFEFDHALAGR